jgi:LmbE family N-acetylglucosaminyl deacetylase
MKFILRVASPMRKLESYDRYLFIGPHPDDIEIGAGSTAAKLVKSGKTVAFVIALDGRYGLDNAPKGTTCEALSRCFRCDGGCISRPFGWKSV